MSKRKGLERAQEANEQARKALEVVGREMVSCADLLHKIAAETPKLAAATRVVLDGIADRLDAAKAGVGIELRDLQVAPARAWLTVARHTAVAVLAVVSTGALEDVGAQTVELLATQTQRLAGRTAEADASLDTLEADEWVTLPGGEVAVNPVTNAVKLLGVTQLDIKPASCALLMLIAEHSKPFRHRDAGRLIKDANDLNALLSARGVRAMALVVHDHSITIDEDENLVAYAIVEWRVTSPQAD